MLILRFRPPIAHFRFTQLLFIALCVASVASGFTGRALAQTKLTPAKNDKMRLTGRLSNLATQASVEAANVPETNPLIIGDLIPVNIRCRGDAEALGTWITSRGGRLRAQEGCEFEAHIPRTELVTLDAHPSVLSVRELFPDRPRYSSQAVGVHNASQWHQYPFTGAGIKVGIIDSFAGYSALKSSELPNAVHARCYFISGLITSHLSDCEALSSSNHGTAVAEAVADVAPGVTFYLAKTQTDGDRRDAVQWMINNGVRVLNYSAARPWDGPGDGSSPSAFSLLNTVAMAANAGVIVVVAAGNEGQSSWLGTFDDHDNNGWADFAGSDDNFIDTVAGQEIDLQLRWQDSWAAASRDLDLCLYNRYYTLIDCAQNYQIGLAGQIPFERLTYTTPVGGRYYIGIKWSSGARPGWIQFQSFNSKQLGIYSAGGSIGNPAESAHPGVLAVGASPWYAPTMIEPFSSRGPTPDGRVKPDIVGVDQADSAARGPSGFAGTSQATPHVAGLAALILHAYPTFSSGSVAQTLKNWAHSQGVIPNNTWGYGLAYLPSIFPLTVTKTGSGDGAVSSTPSLIDCGTSCVRPVLAGQSIALIATPTSGSRFVGWTGACSGAGSCSVSPSSAVTVTARFDAVTITTDADSDGLLDDWEGRFGLSSASAIGEHGPNGDPDHDGRTNRQEYQDGTHPRGFYTKYFAEGAASAFFDTRIAVLNAKAGHSLALLRFQKSNGTQVGQPLSVPALTRATLVVKDVPGMSATEFSTVVESDQELVVDRTMTWDGSGYGSHAETSISTPAMTWYLAEGATHSGFNLFYLIQNPNDQAVSVQVTYLLPAPKAPIVRTYGFAARSRGNIWVDAEGPELEATDVSAKIVGSLPIIVERAMYLDQPGKTFGAGHESAGITTPAAEWFLAEGATGNFFDLFVLIANPGNTDAAIRATFLLPDGSSLVKFYTAPANSRTNLWVDTEDPRLADTAVSTIITSTNGVPVIVERAMWWPGPTAATWAEAHNSAGLTSTGRKWALADGEVGGAPNTETYILIANRGAADTARVSLYYEDGTSESKDVPLPASSRTNVAVAFEFPNSVGKRFGTVVEALGPNPQIAVERAMYSNAGGITWAAGTNAVATKLQ